MKIGEIIAERQVTKYTSSINIVCLGDSVTQGCFDCYLDKDNAIETFFKPEYAYSNVLKRKLNELYPSMRVNIINSGISGDKAERGVDRLEKDVLNFHPDLVIVAYGLNDSSRGMDFLPLYKDSLNSIFLKIKASGAECIYLTPNMMATYVSNELTNDQLKEVAKACSIVQNNGILDKFIEEGRKVAVKDGVEICDMYAIWKKLDERRVDITSLLANKINHPNFAMQEMIAEELLRKIIF